MNERKSGSDRKYTERMLFMAEVGTIDRVRGACVYGQTASDFMRRAIERAVVASSPHIEAPTSTKVDDCDAKDALIAELQEIIARKRSVHAAGQRAWRAGKAMLGGENQAPPQIDDAWYGTIADYVKGYKIIKYPDILSGALGIPFHDHKKVNKTRVGAIMRRLYWEPQKIIIDGKQVRVWVRLP